MQIQSFKKAGKIGKIILLGVANVLLLPICIVIYPLGYECDIAATLLQVVLIWINYEYIRTTWKMCVMDVISMLFTAAGTLYAFILYQRNISNDVEGEAVFGLLFMLWLIISMFAFLLAMARSFHRNGKKKRESVVCGRD